MVRNTYQPRNTSNSELVRKSISRMLSAENYRVLEASDAGQALEIWQIHKEEIEVLMADIQMPGMNGIELVQSACGHTQKIESVVYVGLPGGAGRSASGRSPCAVPPEAVYSGRGPVLPRTTGSDARSWRASRPWSTTGGRSSCAWESRPGPGTAA
ncbi:MAG: hypothetical protein DMG57_29610 [Acidobacteria bacterium]|nr:MAG: hypothetical protein DMG57_29610 [Acidobacteriota bacterium]